MQVDPCHPDVDDPLLWALSRALERRGATVIIDPQGDNLVELGGDGKPVVRVQGLPNLVHEMVHILNAGHLDDDHGIDYARIPFPLVTAADRRLLWDELACCVLSCTYLRDAERVHPWFAEQLEIQPVFYGFEHDPLAFWGLVHGLLAAHLEEWRRVLETSRVGLRDAVGDPILAQPRHDLSVSALWSGFVQARGLAPGPSPRQKFGLAGRLENEPVVSGTG